MVLDDCAAVQMLPGIFDDAPKLGDFKSRLQVTGTLEELGRTWKNLEELGRTWKNLEAGLRCSTTPGCAATAPRDLDPLQSQMQSSG